MNVTYYDYTTDYKYRPDAVPAIYRDGKAKYDVHIARRTMSAQTDVINEQLLAGTRSSVLDVWGLPEHVLPTQTHRIQQPGLPFHWVIQNAVEVIAEGKHAHWVITAIRDEHRT